ncbi:hypothetical protein [Blastococcus sp. CCUG 61487]|uniref:hypothetical protein n=1 Tax=Blastococcus sp. CCUG 61487 TaxID=1840703 RepID=UPI0010C1433C|nr:hypothetical protein [Blastococcus sp. CCUG 61487]TKJ20652.1 hypothetical protein A6V29_08375 [Blastococcus sp. CCUG 61487]
MTAHDQLPIPDYDQLPAGGLTSRIRTLDAQGLRTLLAHERSHANRIQVVRMMEHRLQGLEDGEQPSGGDPAAPAADDPSHTAAGSPVSSATSGPPVNPPSHGDPTNPAQPR